MKTCTKCKETKSLSEFKYRKAAKDKKTSHCRACINAQRKANYESKQDPLRKRKHKPIRNDEGKTCGLCFEMKPYSEYNKDSNKIDGRQVWCASCANERTRLIRMLTSERQVKEYTRSVKTPLGKTCTGCGCDKPLSEFSKTKKNGGGFISWCKDCKRISDKDYVSKNRNHVRSVSKAWKERKLAVDPIFKMKERIGSLIRLCIKKCGYSKKSRSYQILGCTYEEFKVWIEDRFVEGMSWDNHGEWHLDHIVPVSYARNEEELLRLNRFDNFQPLWWLDNIKKGNRYIG